MQQTRFHAVWLVGCGISYGLCRLFNAESIFMQIIPFKQFSLAEYTV